VTPRQSKRQAVDSKSTASDTGLNRERWLELRELTHELSNVTTGMLMASGLLALALAGDRRLRYREQINEAGERTAALVREVRALLQTAGQG